MDYATAEHAEKVLQSDRNRWLDSMADLHGECDREHKSLRSRVERLESRARLISMNEEMKTFLVMTGISVAVAVLVPMVQRAIEKWQQQS